MSPLVQRYLRTGIVFLIVGLATGVVMMVRRELFDIYPSGHLRSAHTHVILVGFVMMMILGVALWMFPRPERDDPRYRPALAEAAYWLVAGGTAMRFVAEVWRSAAPAAPLRWALIAAALGQAVGLGLFFYNLLPRIRSARPPARTDGGAGATPRDTRSG